MPTYLVTGATRGIGLEFVKRLKARGERVIATARGPAPELSSVADSVLPMEATDERSILALAGPLAGEKIDVLINNAGVSSKTKSIETIDATDMRHAFAVNAVAPMLVVRAVLGCLRAGGRKTIVNISSQLASIANNSGGSTYAYRASKSALNQLTVCMANELRPEGFVCVAMHPGWVRTDMGGPQAPLSSEQAVGHMLAVIDRLANGDSGQFLNYDGKPLPW